MTIRRPLRTAPLVVGLAVVGTWISHTLEYLRVQGTTGLRAELTGSVHGYMVPAGIALGLAAVLSIAAIGETYQRLGGRLRLNRSRVLTTLISHRAADCSAPAPRSRAVPGLAQLWLPVLATQLGLYLLQEKIEALRVGVDRPLLGAVSGAHWVAPGIHVYMAFVLSGLALLVLTALNRREHLVERSERLLRAAMARFGRRPTGWRPPRAHVVPLRLRGTHLWCRPPPVGTPV